MNNSVSVEPVRFGIVGTGYAAKLRAEAVMSDRRSQLVAIAGHTPETTIAFAQTYQATTVDSWQQLVKHPEIDLIVICTVNRDHGAIARQALQNGKHVIVEYPLTLDVSEGEELITLAKTQNKLLHVEHIELLGGLHAALKQNLSKIGEVFYARYSTINPQHPAPDRWTYSHELFGFPLMGALSRLHRLTDLFGTVLSVNCQNRFSGNAEDRYTTCFLTTQLTFTSGLLAEVIYGKGEDLWQSERKFEVHGDKGGLIFEGDQGIFIHTEETTPIEVGTRRGLFAKDTSMVLDYLTNGTPLYVTPEASLYTLKIAEAARQSAETGVTKVIED